MPDGIVWDRITHFRTDRHEITDHRLFNGPGSFDRDPFSKFTTSLGQPFQFRQQQRFTPSQDNIWSRTIRDTPREFVERKSGAFWLPRSVGRVTEPAAQVTSGGSDEQRLRPGPRPFSLNGFKNFGDLHD